MRLGIMGPGEPPYQAPSGYAAPMSQPNGTTAPIVSPPASAPVSTGFDWAQLMDTNTWYPFAIGGVLLLLAIGGSSKAKPHKRKSGMIQQFISV